MNWEKRSVLTYLLKENDCDLVAEFIEEEIEAFDAKSMSLFMDGIYLAEHMFERDAEMFRKVVEKGDTMDLSDLDYRGRLRYGMIRQLLSEVGGIQC